jgi:GDP-L-fucose synthase
MSDSISKNSRIYIAGHQGLIGSALMERLRDKGFNNLIFKPHSELDLTRQNNVEVFFTENKPEYVILNAAMPANSINVSTNPVGLMLDNTAIITNIISASLKNNVEKLLYICSIAAYPSDAERISSPDGPLFFEDSMQPGRIDKVSERYYAIPKLLGEEMCRVINQTGKMPCVSAVIPHAYGMDYHYEDPDRLPVFPALIKRIHDALQNGAPEVVIWGSGKLRRELTFSMDIADAYIMLLNDKEAAGVYNVGSGRYVSIREMAETIKEISGYQGTLVFDATKPESIEFPLLCSDKLRKLGWKADTDFKEGVRKAYEYYVKHFA